MIKLISPYTGAKTLIANDRLQEYLDAGYRKVEAEQAKPAEPEKPVKQRKKAVKK